MENRIGIIAGKGQFPRLISSEAKSRGLQVFTCGFQGHTDFETLECADTSLLIYIGQFKKLIDFFLSHQVTHVCMAGSIHKPSVVDIRPDLLAAKLLFNIKKKGDDSILRAVIAELEKHGLKILSAADLVPSLRSPEGVLTKRPPTQSEWENIRFAWSLSQDIAKYDIGQSIIVKENMIAAIECLEGTDVAIQRGAELAGAGCIAVKLSKKGQEQRVDLPSIGLTTIQNLIKRKYCCLAIEAGNTLFFNQQEAISLADQANLSIVSISANHNFDNSWG